MTGHLKRLISSLGAYQAPSILAKLLAVGMLPVYTRSIDRADYGAIELLANGVILISIIVRLGIIEAFLRFYFSDDDPRRRDALVRRATVLLLVTTTVASVVLFALAGPLSGIVLEGRDRVALFRVAVLGLWSFTNLELAYGVLRVDQRLREYVAASVANVAITVASAAMLVVAFHLGARGYLLGNYATSAIVLVVLWWRMRDRLVRGGLAAGRLESMRTLMRFGLPTVPAEASVYLLSIVDRFYIYHSRSPAVAGLYSIAVKLAGAVALIVTAFQYAWPPLAYSVADDREAGRLYGLVATYYLLLTGWVVTALALEGRWILRLLAAPAYFGAYRALPWVALGWALYGLWVIFLTIAGRAKVTTRNFPAAIVGLAANVGLLLWLVPSEGIAGAGLALCGAYVVMLAFMHLLTRGEFHVDFQWLRLSRLALVLAVLGGGGDLVLPTHGAAGFGLRLLAVVAIAPGLFLVGFVHPAEIRQARALVSRLRRGRSVAAGSGA